jgi:hypothetical protein
MYVSRNIEARSRKHCFRGKTSIKYRERVCVCVFIRALVIRHANRSIFALYYIVICGVSDYHIFPHYLINDMIFEKSLFNTKCVF